MMLVAIWLQALQARIDAAAPGDTIQVPPGVYRENLVIAKPLTLAGEGRPVIDGGGGGHVILITARGVTIRGFVIRGSGDSFLYEHSGVMVRDAPDAVIENCEILDALFGIYLQSSPGARVAGNRVVGKDLEVARRGDGIRLFNADGCVLADNVVEKSRDFVLWYSNGTVIERNVVRHSRYGLHYMNSDDNEFADNRFEHNEVAAAIMYSDRLRLRRNTFSFSRGVSAYGLLLKDCDDLVIEENRFLDNTRGIFFDNCPSREDGTCVVRGNAIAYNDAGLVLLPHTRRVQFEGNAFVENLAHVTVQGPRDRDLNAWSGNYWSGFLGYDADGDGRSEIAYRPMSLYEDLLGRHPELALLRFSPSVGALEAASKVMPAIRAEELLVDPSPAVSPTLPPVAPGEAPTRSPGIAAGAASLLALLTAGVWRLQVRFP